MEQVSAILSGADHAHVVATFKHVANGLSHTDNPMIPHGAGKLSGLQGDQMPAIAARLSAPSVRSAKAFMPHPRFRSAR